MKIIIYPSQKLGWEANKVRTAGQDLEYVKDFSKELETAMVDNDGIGLAATQVGSSIHMFVFKSEQLDKIVTMTNPDIVWCEGRVIEEEACLSIPGMSAKIERSAVIGVKYYDIWQETVTSGQFGGRNAIVIQHELDHLSGTLYIDHLSSLKRRIFKKKYAKMQKIGKIPKY